MSTSASCPSCATSRRYPFSWSSGWDEGFLGGARNFAVVPLDIVDVAFDAGRDAVRAMFAAQAERIAALEVSLMNSSHRQARTTIPLTPTNCLVLLAGEPTGVRTVRATRAGM